MVLNLFKTLASKNEAAHHRTQNHHQSRGNQEMLHAPAGYQRFVGTTGTSSSGGGGGGSGASSALSSARISRMARSLPQHVPEVLTRPDSSSSSAVGSSHSSRPASHSFGSGGGGLNPRLATGHHLLTGGGSLSAPSSPSQLSKSSSIPLKMRQGVVSRHGAPPPNIIVEKGRIEFVKTANTSPSAPPASAVMAVADAPVPTTTTLTTEKHKLQMGTKIFRPPTSSSSSPSPKKSTLPESTSPTLPLAGQADEMPPKGHQPKSKETASTPSGGSISFRDRSASPKFNSTRESTPPLPESSRIPSGMVRKPNPTTPDVVGSHGRNLLPRPGFINKSRETSPSPQQSSSSSSSTSCSSAKPSSIPSAPPSKSGSSSSNSGASGGGGVSGAAVPVSPNLIRWRAKLSGSSGPCVTNHLNLNVSAAAAAAATTATTTTNNSSVAGSHPKKTLGGIGAALVKLSGNGAKSGPSSSSSACTSTSSKPTSSTSAVVAAAAAPTAPAVVAQVDEGSTTPADAQPTASATASDNQMQLLNLHYEVKRLEETVHTLLPLRHQQSALIQSYEERLSEAQTRLAAAEAEVAQLKERLARCEGAEVDGRQVIQQLEADKSSMAASHEQQRLVFDKCLDEIANHVVQALISQKNLQGECRRLRSQVSDLEQRNVALNLLLTQSLRDSMLENNKKPTTATASDGMMVKSNSYDLPPSSSCNQRDSLCSTVSDSEIRMSSSSSIFETGSGVRPLVSKDSNWTLSSTSSSASSTASQAALAVQQSSEQSNPVERAEKLLAVLKHRLFSAQLNSYKSIRMQPKNNSEIRRSLVMPSQQQPAEAAQLPARPSTLSFCPSAPVSTKETGAVTSANDPSTPSVRALVQVLEKRVGNPLPSSSSSSLEKPDKSPRPPLPLAPGLVRSIRNAAATSGDSSNDSPASKDEGYSTMSSDVQVDSSSSSSSSFIASGCSSPATLRRSASGSTPSSTTRSLPIAKRKTLLNSSSTCSAYSSSLSSSTSDSTRPSQPNRSISLQETHSGAAGLEELKEEASDETNEDAGSGRCPDSSVAPSSSQFSDYGASSFKREWPGVQLGTLCEDWSPSSVASDSEDVESDRDGLFSRATNQEEQSLPKWKSDDELYKADQEEDVVAGEESWKTLDLRNKSQQSEHDAQHPLRRSRAQVQLSSDPSAGPSSSVPALPRGQHGCRVPPNYSEHEMEDWILDDREHEPSPSESEETNGATALPAISENSYESDGDDEEEEEEEELFIPEIYSPTCDGAGQEAAESEAEADEEEDDEDDDAEEESLDTEFTRDYYRLVKFESNRSLANSEKYDHCPPGAETASSDSSAGLLPPPDRQVALQTVLDFIAEQQRYCAIRETADAGAPELPHPNGLDKDPSIGSSTLLQLRHLIADGDSSREEDSSDDEGALGRDGAVLHSGFSTNWMPVHGSRVELVDLNNAEVRASMLEKLFRSSSSSSLNESSSSDSFEGNEGRGNLESSEDSCPPPIASPSQATEESQC